MEFKDRLVARRTELGLSVAVAAARVGVEGPNYRAWEAGRRTPPEERQAVILASLDVAEDRAEYQRGALWALAAMHETLARCYRELAQPAPALPIVSQASGIASFAPSASGLGDARSGDTTTPSSRGAVAFAAPAATPSQSLRASEKTHSSQRSPAFLPDTPDNRKRRAAAVAVPIPESEPAAATAQRPLRRKA